MAVGLRKPAWCLCLLLDYCIQGPELRLLLIVAMEIAIATGYSLSLAETEGDTFGCAACSILSELFLFCCFFA